MVSAGNDNMIEARKAKILMVLLMVGLILVSGCVKAPDTKKVLNQKFSDFKNLYDEKLSQNCNVTEAGELAKKAKQAFDNGNYVTANELLDKASVMLNEAEKNQTSPVNIEAPPGQVPQLTDQTEARKKFSNIKVASQYRRITDGMRSVDDVIGIFKATNTDFIFQGWMRQNPAPETCSDLTSDKRAACDQQGYSYEYLRNANAKIKKEMPDVIIGGGFLAEFLYPDSWNEMTGKTYTRDQIWEMSLDPTKWGIKQSRDEFQTELAIKFGWTTKGASYNPKEKMNYYFPDLTNPEVKELYLSWAEKQIDSGVDSLWIDALYGQPFLLKELTGDVNHPAVKESFEAASDIVDKIHEYGLSKGKYIYVVTWGVTGDFTMMLDSPYPTPALDGLMTSISAAEIRSLKLNENRWKVYTEKLREKFGDIPIFARIDYGNVGSPLAAFSELPKEQANQFLKTSHEFFKQKGIIFIYPIHGGNMGKIGQKGKVLSFGQYDWYDALAPEFQTYETIKELDQNWQ